MNKIFFFFLLLFSIVNQANAQRETSQIIRFNGIATNPDQYLLDSLKQIVKRGIRYDLFGKKNAARQLQYINACISLGKYYEKQFDSGELKTMKQSIAYYQKVVDTYYDMGSYNEDNSEALSTIAAISRKLSTVYFKGKGVRKNIKLSYQYAQQGLGHMDALLPFYAKRFFNTDNLFLNRKNLDDPDGGKICLLINPFTENISLYTPADKLMLEKIAIEFNRADTSKNLNLIISTYILAKIKSQSQAERYLSSVKGFFIEKMNISEDKIMIESTMGGAPSTIQYRGIPVRYLLIQFKRADM